MLQLPLILWFRVCLLKKSISFDLKQKSRVKLMPDVTLTELHQPVVNILGEWHKPF